MKPPTSRIPTCQHCNSKMMHGKITQKHYWLQILAVFLFITGLFLLFSFPIGTILGLILMLGSSRIGYIKKDGWICHGCGYKYTL